MCSAYGCPQGQGRMTLIVGGGVPSDVLRESVVGHGETIWEGLCEGSVVVGRSSFLLWTWSEERLSLALE